MEKLRIRKNSIKYLIGLLVVVALRLVPHPPNVEPIMASMMPFTKKWGWLSGLVFCLLAIFAYDVLTGTLGIWSLVTAGTYALLGAAAGLYFKNKKNQIRHYVGFAIAATLIYDAITGIGMGTLIFHQPLMGTLVGQIPFTLYHLLGNIVLASVLSPRLLYKWIITNPKLEARPLWNRICANFL